MLLLPDNVRIRRFNLSSEQYSDYVDNAEHIQALDYLWDPEGEGLSKSSSLNLFFTFYFKDTANRECKPFSVTYLLCSVGIVYWTVLGQGPQFGSIKRAYMTTFNDYGNNPVKETNLNLRYIVKPEGIAVDWVGR